MIRYFSVNGKLVPREEAVLHITDLAILRGYGLFDFFVVKQGKPLFFDQYLDRFEFSASQLRLSIPFTRKELKKLIMEVVVSNHLENAGLKLVLTGGYSEDGYSPAVPNLLILASPPPVYPDSKYTDGVSLMLYEYQRTFPHIKSINYLVGVSLLPQMRAAGAEDILFHYNDQIHETTRANFFLVMDDGTVVTPAEGILKGITRNVTVGIAREHFRMEERNISLKDLDEAREAFITSSTKQIMPVVKVGEQIIAKGKPGPVTLQLLSLLREKEAAYLGGC